MSEELAAGLTAVMLEFASRAPRRSQEESVALANAGRPYLIVHPDNRFDVSTLAVEGMGVAVIESQYIPPVAVVKLMPGFEGE